MTLRGVVVSVSWAFRQETPLMMSAPKIARSLEGNLGKCGMMDETS